MNKGPWLKKGKLKATELEIMNYSSHDPDGNLLHFCLVMTGPFQKAEDYSLSAVATFDVTSDNYEMKYDHKGDDPVFQRGYDFDAIIEILETPAP